MKSPFPGMDPYLEAHWRDVHASLTTYIRDSLQAQLPPDLVARVDEEVIIDYETGVFAVRYRPDVSVNAQVILREEPAGGALLDEPLIFEAEEEMHRFVEARESRSGRVVTVVEVLSPTNRLPGSGREAYLQKRRDYLAAGVNVMEIDLLRTGVHTVGVSLGRIPEERQTQYYTCIWRAEAKRWELYCMALPSRLPTVHVPLRWEDTDVQLNLQALVEVVYQQGRYHLLAYGEPLVPPLAPPEAAWASGILQATGHS